MSNVQAILRREFAAYFNSPLGYIVVAAFLLSFGAFFFYIFDVFTGQLVSMRPLFGIAPLLLAILTPMVTMRLVAEERHSGTIELLLTLPLSEWEVVLGKYLAGVGVVATATLLTITYPLTLSAFGDLDLGPVVGGYLGLLLLAASYTALGLLCSTLTSNQIVAALSALLLSFLFWVADKAAWYAPGFFGDTLRYISFDARFMDIQRGVVDTRHLVYYLSVILVSLSLAAWSLRRQRLAA